MCYDRLVLWGREIFCFMLTMQFLVSTGVILLLAYGLYQRHNRKIHIPVMFTAFGIDLALVLYIELTKGAVEQAIDGPTPLLGFHILISLITVLLYIALIILGVQVLQGKQERIVWHRKLAYVFIACRLVNYVTSFWIGT